LYKEDNGHIGLSILPSGDKQKKENADWGEVFTTLICHTSMRYEEIGERTIPQLETILARLNKHISLKIGIPIKEETSTREVAREATREHTVDEALAFCALFNGID